MSVYLKKDQPELPQYVQHQHPPSYQKQTLEDYLNNPIVWCVMLVVLIVVIIVVGAIAMNSFDDCFATFGICFGKGFYYTLFGLLIIAFLGLLYYRINEYGCSC